VIDQGNIPFLDLVTPHVELEDRLCEVFKKALRSAGFVGGSMVEEFEREFATYCDSQYCAGVGSGTDALRFALLGAGVTPGTIVITVPNTFIATTEAISQAGARPAFVDVDEHSYNMDPEALREYLETQCELGGSNDRTIHKETGETVAAVVPVHLYGQMANMDAILELADRYNLVVVEDACQAHGAQYFSEKAGRWRVAGSMGRAAAFSFYPGKNLGACGEAGAVTTNDPELAARVRMMRDHGQARKYFHDCEGYNGRLDAIQAGILKIKLQHLAEWNAKRQTNAARYRELLDSPQGVLRLPYEPSWSKAVHHLYVVQVENRDQFQQDMAEAGIGTGIHYPVPLHLQKAYGKLGYGLGDFPVAEAAASRIISLPMYPGLGADQQRRVAEYALRSVARTADRQSEFAPSMAYGGEYPGAAAYLSGNAAEVSGR
jgi:dTDP-4-amino-4,6-dideoxygalactose transaminase